MGYRMIYYTSSWLKLLKSLHDKAKVVSTKTSLTKFDVYLEFEKKVILYKIKTKLLGMCTDIPMVNSQPIGSPFHQEYPQQGSFVLRTVHLVIILLRHVRYNKDWGTLANSEPQTL